MAEGGLCVVRCDATARRSGTLDGGVLFDPNRSAVLAVGLLGKNFSDVAGMRGSRPGTPVTLFWVCISSQCRRDARLGCAVPRSPSPEPGFDPLIH